MDLPLCLLMTSGMRENSRWYRIRIKGLLLLIAVTEHVMMPFYYKGIYFNLKW